MPISQISAEAANRQLTGIGELDRVLGGGLVAGVAVLLAGEPGVGKSTLLLAVAAKWAQAGRRTLYVTGEESAAQVRLRADRTDALASQLFLAAETDLGTVLGHVEQVAPTLMVVDSVQTITAGDAEGAPGGMAQVREVTAALVRVAKNSGMPVIIIDDITDEFHRGPAHHGAPGGRGVELRRRPALGFRMVRAVKNRFGPADKRWAVSRWPSAGSSRCPTRQGCSSPITPSRCPAPV